MTITLRTFQLILAVIGLFAGGVLFGTITAVRIYSTSNQQPKVIAESLPRGWIAIDPNQTECWTLKGLEKIGYLNPGDANRQTYSVYEGESKVEPIRAQTLRCKFIDATDLKTPYPKTLEFYLYQTWYKWKRGKI